MAERRYQIHPAIGIARVGNAVRSDTSNDFYFIGPEFPDIAAKSGSKKILAAARSSDSRCPH